jgi:hypothetical protein
MKIKIKIKILILLIFVFTITLVWIIPTAILGIANSLEYKGSDKATFFYQKYASYPTTSDIKGSFLYAKSLVKSHSKFTIYFNSWGGGGNTSPEDMEKSKEILQGILKEPFHKESEKQYYIDSYKLLLDLAIATGDVDMLNNWISFGQEVNDEKLKYTSDIYSGFLFHVNGDRDGARRIVTKYDKTDFADVNLDILRAEISLFDGNYEEAKKIYENMTSNNFWEFDKDNFGSNGYDNRNFWFDNVLEVFKGDNVIRGTISYEGEPMPFVEIYVQAADGGIRVGGESYIGITDKNGEFETLGLKDGVYNIGIGVEGSLLADKVLQRPTNSYFELDGDDGEINFEFKNTMGIKIPESDKKISGEEFTVSWEEVDGADYYTVEIVTISDGAIFRSPTIDVNGQIKFTKTSATFNIDLLKSNISGISRWEEGLLGPEAVLGLFLPGVEHPIVVNAYDENKNLITSSLPQRTYYDQIPSVKVGGSLTEGEKIILNQDYPEAIQYYENILEDEPDNTDALRYLTKIYGIGWKYGEENIKRAIELGERLTDVIGDNSLLINIIELMEIDEIKENSELYYSAVLEDSEDHDDSYYYNLSRYYIATENWEGARNALQNREEYVSTDLFYLNIYFENYIEAAENAKYTQRNLTSVEVKEALKELEENPPQPKDKQVFDNFLLNLVKGVQREEGKTLYRETVRQISNSNIQTILHEVYLERGWDISY